MCYSRLHMIKKHLVTQMIHSILWPAQSRYHFVGCFLFSIYWPFLRFTKLIAWLHPCVFGICGTVHMNKDCSLISPSFLWLKVSPNKYKRHDGDFLGDTLIYNSRGVKLWYCCLLQKYKGAFKRKLFGAVLCLPLIAVHSRKCHIILWKVFC